MKRVIVLLTVLAVSGFAQVNAQKDKVYTSLDKALVTPEKVYQLDLSFSSKKYQAMPDTVSVLKNLTHFFLQNSMLTDVSDSIEQLKNLEVLWLGNVKDDNTKNELNDIPDAVWSLEKLQVLHLENCGLEMVPETIGAMSELRELYLRDNHLYSLPRSIGKLRNLQVLVVYNNPLESLPESMAGLENLKTLVLTGTILSDTEKEKIKKMLPNCKLTF